MPFEAHYSRDRLLGYTAIGLILAGVGLWFLLDPAAMVTPGGRLDALAAITTLAPTTQVAIVGAMALAFGVGCSLGALHMMAHAGPAIRIDADGVFWHRWGPDPIPWSNIASVRAFSVQRQPMVGLVLIDPGRSPGRGLAGRLARLNAALGFGHVGLVSQGTNRSHDELLAALEHFTPR